MAGLQQHALERQDEQLEKLGLGVNRVKALAGTMRDELADQAVILDSLEEDVDRAEGNMQGMTSKLKSLMSGAKDSEKAQYGIICVLIVVLVFLVSSVLE